MPRSLVLVLLLAGCASTLPDGVYDVPYVADSADALPVPGPGARVMRYDRSAFRSEDELPPVYVLLVERPYAPLRLAEPPRDGEVNGRAVLLLSLTPDAGRALTELTARAKRAAVVIGGQVVTVHRVRAPIEGGRLQVSC